jgi:hypothetical protein
MPSLVTHPDQVKWKARRVVSAWTWPSVVPPLLLEASQTSLVMVPPNLYCLESPLTSILRLMSKYCESLGDSSLCLNFASCIIILSITPWVKFAWGTSAWGFQILCTSRSASSARLWASSLAVLASLICSWRSCGQLAGHFDASPTTVWKWGFYQSSPEEAGYLWIELFNQCCLCHQGIFCL